jgi:hypothetical protein
MNMKASLTIVIFIAAIFAMVALSISISSVPFNYKTEAKIDANSSSSDNNTNIIVRQGTVASEPPMIPGDPTRFATILQPRPNGSVYTGTVSFTASKKVDVFVLHSVDKNGSSLINSTYKEPASFLIGPKQSVAPTLIVPDYKSSFIPSGSIQSLEIHLVL